MAEEFEIVSLTFFKEWHELAKKYKLTMEQYGAVVHAMCEYGFYNVDTKMEPPHGIIYDMAKPYIKSSNSKKMAGHKGGKNGGAPEGNDNAKKRFIKPTLEELRQYIQEKNYSIDAEAFIAFYESKGWKIGKNPMKDWKAACVTWEKGNRKNSSEQPRRHSIASDNIPKEKTSSYFREAD